MDEKTIKKNSIVPRPAFFVSRINAIILSAISSALLILAFPKTDYAFLSWIAFLPLFFVLDKSRGRPTFFWSYLSGVLFFAGMLYWFVHVTYTGAILLTLYCSLYFAFFGSAYFFARRHHFFVRMIFLPSMWVVLEFARSNLFSGFGWVALGHSQYTNLTFLQLADVAGVYGISFIVMLTNVSLKEIITLEMQKKRKQAIVVFLTLVLILSSVFVYGKICLARTYEGKELNVSLVQANIPQELKWNEPFWPDILAKYKIMTKRAALDYPDLIMWPETAFPGYVGEHDDIFNELKLLVKEIKIPVLFGSVVKEGETYYNSALLLDKSGNLVNRYHKLHLVPFGEFIPFRSLFPFLSQIVPIADFTKGRDFTLFPLDSEGHYRFAALVCFEDSLPYLSRQLVKRGANLLVNITNDAWFKDSKEPFLHLQTSVFRAVELRRELIRSTNTGISGFINAKGEISHIVKDNYGKKTYIDGISQKKVFLLEGMTIYAHLGDWFVYGCMLIVSVFLGTESFKSKKARLRKPI